MKLKLFSVLSDNELSDIHRASLEVLSETGMIIYSDKVLKLLQDAGCKVDIAEKRVRIPESLVEQALKTVPPKAIPHPGFW